MGAADDSLREITAGFTAGVVTTLVMHPLDVIKVRLQVDAIKPWSFLTLRDMYRGLGINVLGNAASWGIYFYSYNEARKRIGDGHSWYLLSALIAGSVTGIATTPFWVIKTRMLATRSNDLLAYKSFTQGFRSVFKNEGVWALYRGVVPGMFGTLQAAIQFSLYENFKVWRRNSRSRPRPESELKPEFKSASDKDTTAPFSSLEYITLSAVSKIISASAMYPYQVVRSRIQVQKTAKFEPVGNLINTARKVYGESGLKGFYRGMIPSLLRVVPSTSITFLVYETVNDRWKGRP